jgi:hypothetical protein
MIASAYTYWRRPSFDRLSAVQLADGVERPELYRFLDAGDTEAGRTLSEPASKKRRCTKSRDAGQRLGASAMGISA